MSTAVEEILLKLLELLKSCNVKLSPFVGSKYIINPTVELSNFTAAPPNFSTFVEPDVVIRAYLCPTLLAKNAADLPGVAIQF